MSLFAGIENEEGATGRNSPDITPGLYTFELLGLEDGKTPFTKEEFFRAKVKVVESSGEPVAAKDGSQVKPLAAGTEAEIFIMRDKYKYYITDIKNLIAAIATSHLGEEVLPNQVSQANIDEMLQTGEANGVKFKAQFVPKAGKFMKTGVPATLKKFTGIVGQASAAA